MPIIIKLFKSVLGNSYGKFLGEIPRGNSILTNSHMTKKYKKSNFALVKSLVLFYGQVSKALRSISHWLVSLLVAVFAG